MFRSIDKEKEDEFANQIEKLCNLLSTEKNVIRQEQLLKKLEEVLSALERYKKSVLNAYRTA